jgi:hypothetical protein
MIYIAQLHKRFCTHWQWLGAIFCVFWLISAPPAFAAPQQVVVLTQDATPGREEAKRKALHYAKQLGLARIARKLDPEQAQAFFAKIDQQNVDPFIRGIEVLDETYIEGVYYARVRVSVFDLPILQAMGKTPQEDEAAEKRAVTNIMVLPVFYDGVEPHVWDAKKNPGYALWQEMSLTVAHGALIVPTGEPGERAMVDRDNVLRASYEELKPLMERYGVSEIAIVVLQDTLLHNKAPEVEVLMRRLRPGGQKIEQFAVAPEQSRAPRVGLYHQAIDKAARILMGAAMATSYQDRVERAKSNQQPFVMQFTTLRQRATIDHILRETEGFGDLEPSRIALHEGAGTLYIKGSVAAYADGLVKAGLIVDSAAEGWVIRLAR